MKKLLPIAILIGSSLLSPLKAQDEFEDNRYLYVMHKFYGACGFISEMNNLQKGLKMDGADDYILKVLEYASARIGYSSKDFLSTCGTAKYVASNPQSLNVENIPQEDLKPLLSISQFTGYCGMYSSAAEVVNSNDEQSFLVRFLSTELVKSELGDLEQFIQFCENANTAYSSLTGQE